MCRKWTDIGKLKWEMISNYEHIVLLLLLLLLLLPLLLSDTIFLLYIIFIYYLCTRISIRARVSLVDFTRTGNVL